MQIHFLNHTRKQSVYIGEAEDDNITFVFTHFGWKITDKITMLRSDCLEEYEDYEELE